MDSMLKFPVQAGRGGSCCCHSLCGNRPGQFRWQDPGEGYLGGQSKHYLLQGLACAKSFLCLTMSDAQVEKEEVRLRRTIGLKKDEYQLNKKRIT